MVLFEPLDIEPINAAQQTLARIFSDDYVYTVPPYQRPYAWVEDQARDLFNDVETALDEALSTKEPITYFFGSIVLIRAIIPGLTF